MLDKSPVSGPGRGPPSCNKSIPCWWREGQEFCCSSKLLFGYKFSKKIRMQQQLAQEFRETKEKAVGYWFCSPKAHSDTEQILAWFLPYRCLASTSRRTQMESPFLQQALNVKTMRRKPTNTLSLWQCSVSLRVHVTMSQPNDTQINGMGRDFKRRPRTSCHGEQLIHRKPWDLPEMFAWGLTFKHIP